MASVEGGGRSGSEGSVASDPDFAAVCSFLRVFGSTYGIETPSISELQRTLEDTTEVSEVLRDVQVKLLRRALKSVQPERWERSLVKFCHQHSLHKEAWELERFSYKKASARVKLAVLKVLLEYQFTCHVKFKTAVNSLASSELRLEPVGRDRGGRVYWLQTDPEANLRLYREDQDEETWTLIARDREGLVKVITQLKNGEDSTTADDSLLNEDSNSLLDSTEKKIPEENEDSNEEFLSPESESEHESDNNTDDKHDKENKSTSVSEEHENKEEVDAKEINSDKLNCNNSAVVEKIENEQEASDKESLVEDSKQDDEVLNNVEKQLECDPKEVILDASVAVTENPEDQNETKQVDKETKYHIVENDTKGAEDNDSNKDDDNLTVSKEHESVEPSIEEPVMVVTGEGNGADCESGDYGPWDEIEEQVMYFWGEGCGYDCDTGNPGETATEVNCDKNLGNLDSSNKNEHKTESSDFNIKVEAINNGVITSDSDSNTTSSSKKVKVLENIADKLKNDHFNVNQNVTKRMLHDNCQASETKPVESTPKKPCIWNVESIVNKSESSDEKLLEKEERSITNSQEDNSKSEENGCNHDAKLLTNTEANSSNVSKCRKEQIETNNIDSSNNKVKDENSINAVSENEHKTSESTELSDKKVILEKRKSSLSSEDEKRSQDTECVEKMPSKEISPLIKKQIGKHKQAKTRRKGTAKVLCKPDVEILPSKKLRLDSTTDEGDKAAENSAVVGELNVKDEKDVKDGLVNNESHVVTKNKSKPVSKAEDTKQNKLDDSGIVLKKSRVERNKKKSIKETETADAKKEQVESGEQTSLRVPKKVGRGKSKRLIKRNIEKTTADGDSDKNLNEIASKNKEVTKSLGDVVAKSVGSNKDKPEKRKRTRNKVESVSEEDEEESLMGKRLKMKPKRVLLCLRKKVEAKLNHVKDSSEESEETEVTPKRGKSKRSSSPKKETKGKLDKKVKKKSIEGKKNQCGAPTLELDATPVRQSRRIAQLKIREEAERRQMEEVALRELKIKHKKKVVGDGEEEWKASAGEVSSGSEDEARRRRRGDKWPQSDTSAPASDSDTDEPLFDREYEEPDLVFKSDHEFSPESDLEDGGTAAPLKRARTLKEEEDGFCVRCGRGDQPEWILLCDDCDAGYHASCLKPVLFLVPDGDWYCPACQHQRLIKSLEAELVKFDELAVVAEQQLDERKSLKLAADRQAANEKEKQASEGDNSSSSSGSGSSEDEGTVYRLRERRQVPVSLRAQEYDRLMSTAIKEEYKEPTSSAGNQGRGKDISTIIEAAEEEKQKAEAEAYQAEGGDGAPGKRKKPPRPRRKPRKLNSLDVPSEDDDEIDEDFKDTGWESSSESISSDAEGDGGDTDSRSSDSLPIRRSGRESKKSRKKLDESPETKKKKGVFDETSSDSSGTKDWSKKKKSPKKRRENRDGTRPKKSKKKKGLKQYDAEGNVIKTRVRYGGLSGSEGSNDWSPKHRTRQKKINYTEMPNTESEDEMHKPSGKHMPDSSDEFRLSSDASSDSDGRRKRANTEDNEPAAIDEAKMNTLKDLISKTPVVPLHKLPEDVTRAKTEALEAQLNARVEAAVGTATPRPARGKGSRGGRGSRGPRGGGRAGTPRTPTASSAGDPGNNLLGVKVKDLSQTPDLPPTPVQMERERKRQEREMKLAEKEARKQDRIKKKEEKDQLKELRAKEREEKKQAKLALVESKKQRKEKMEGLPVPIPIGGFGNGPRPPGARAAIPGPPHDVRMGVNINQQFADFQRMRHPSAANFDPRGPPGPRGPSGPAEAPPRLQVRPELRAMRPDLANVRAPGGAQAQYQRSPHPAHHVQREERRDPALREGTLSVAGSPQPFKPVTDPPSIITRMPHMIPPQYRGAPMYVPGSPYDQPPPGARPHMMYMHNPHPLDPSPSGGGPINMNTQPFPPGYYPRGYHPPRFPNEPPAQHSTPPPPIETKIKAEIKTEPETSSPSQSPARPASPPEEQRHPKMKHTEGKERARTTMAARYPHGPYAPQYGPYGPYAPPEGYSTHTMQAGGHPVHRMPPHQGQPMVSHHHGPPPHHAARPHMSHQPGPPPGASVHRQGPPVSVHRPHQSPHPPGPSHQSLHPAGGPIHQSLHPQTPPKHQSPLPQPIHQLPHPQGAGSHQSAHPLGAGSHQSPHPQGAASHQSPHPQGEGPHQSPHAQAVASHQSPHPQGPLSRQSPHPHGAVNQSSLSAGNTSRQSPHLPGAPTHHSCHPPGGPAHHPPPPLGGATLHSPHPSVGSTHQTSHPPGTTTHQLAHPGAHSRQSPHLHGGATHQSPHPQGIPLHQSAHPGGHSRQSPHPHGVTHQSPNPHRGHLNQSPHPAGGPTQQSRHQQGGPIHLSPHPPGAHSHKSPYQPGPNSNHVPHQTPTHQSSHLQGPPSRQSPHPPGGPLLPPPTTSPMNTMQSTPPPPAVPRRPPELIHHPPKMAASSLNDSVNLVAHNRPQSPPSVAQRLGPPPLLRSPALDGNGGHSVALTVPSANVRQLTPMELSSSKVTLLDGSEGPRTRAVTPEHIGVMRSNSPLSGPLQGQTVSGQAPRREEEGGSVFGGLVSYFSSQQEDDIDG